MPKYVTSRTVAEWLTVLESVGVPCGPVNTIPQVFEDEHIKHRGMKIEMDHPLAKDGKVPLVANPVTFSKTPVEYRLAPPTCGQHTYDILDDILGLSLKEIEQLKSNKTIA